MLAPGLSAVCGPVGVILMVVGVIGLVVTAIWMSTRRRTDVIRHANGTTYVTPREPIDTI
jgi:FtsZ-interacting cell division protein ZipA